MSTINEKTMVNSYFRLMRNWNNETKKELIIKLTSSIDELPNDKFDFSLGFGEWEDETTAGEMIKNIYSDRVIKK